MSRMNLGINYLQSTGRQPAMIYVIMAQLFERRLALTRGKIFILAFFFFLSKALFRIILFIPFRVSNHQIVGKENST